MISRAKVIDVVHSSLAVVIGSAATLAHGEPYYAYSRMQRRALTMFVDWVNGERGGLRVGGCAWAGRGHAAALPPRSRSHLEVTGDAKNSASASPNVSGAPGERAPVPAGEELIGAARNPSRLHGSVHARRCSLRGHGHPRAE